MNSLIMPIRIQRKRTKGWKMPENTISVTRPGKYGNPFPCGGCNNLAVKAYKEWIEGNKPYAPTPPSMDEIKQDLQGKNLACWCKTFDTNGNYNLCHADILLSIANDKTLEEIKNENINNIARQKSGTSK